LPEGRGTEIRLPRGEYSVDWYNPRAGGELMTGSVIKAAGSGPVSTGRPPVEDMKDWVCLIRREQ
ncbi:MAG: hypothetical protein R6W81_12395, partial [Bacteroidales bacterium]